MLSILNEIEFENSKSNWYSIENLMHNDKFYQYINNESEVIAEIDKYYDKNINENKRLIAEIKFDRKNYFLYYYDNNHYQKRYLKINKISFRRIYIDCFGND